MKKQSTLSLIGGDVEQLWRSATLPKLVSKPDALIGFLNTNGHWNSRLDRQFWATPDLKPAMYGRYTGGDWVSDFHKPVGELHAVDLENVYAGRAIFAPGAEDPERIFQHVLWGVLHFPMDMKTAMRNAIRLAYQRIGESPHLVLPWFGSFTTLPQPKDVPQVERQRIADNWSRHQVEGIIQASQEVASPFHLTVLYAPRTGEDVNWLTTIIRIVDEMKLEDSITVSSDLGQL